MGSNRLSHHYFERGIEDVRWTGAMLKLAPKEEVLQSPNNLAYGRTRFLHFTCNYCSARVHRIYGLLLKLGLTIRVFASIPPPTVFKGVFAHPAVGDPSRRLPSDPLPVDVACRLSLHREPVSCIFGALVIPARAPSTYPSFPSSPQNRRRLYPAHYQRPDAMSAEAIETVSSFILDAPPGEVLLPHPPSLRLPVS